MSTVELKSEFLKVAMVLFEQEGVPMRPKRLVDLGIDRKLFSDKIHGRTPHQTMKSKLSVHIRTHGKRSPFIRTAPGVFFLNRLLKSGEEVYNATPLRAPPAAENVLVFPTSLLDEFGRIQGIKTTWKVYLRRLLNGGACRYIDRLEAERDDRHKQLLTYIMVRRGNQVLSYKRGVFNRIEDFLRGSRCIGFGGHTTAADRDLFSAGDEGLRNCAIRELFEELELPERDKRRLREGKGLTVVGLLNDDSSATGRRHFAVVYEYRVADGADWDKPVRGEKSITQLKWVSPEEGDIGLIDYEYWSQLCIRKFFGNVASEQAGFLIRRKSRFRGAHVLCVIGPIGSGKTQTTSVLTRDHGYDEVNSGRVLADVLKLHPVNEATRKEFQSAASAFIAKRGAPKRFGKKLAGEVNVFGSDRVLVDGIRHKATLDALVEAVKPRKVAVLFIYTPPDLALRFYRGRSVDSISPLDFFAIREADVESEVDSLIGHGDAVVYNWTGKQILKRTVGALMAEVGS